MNRVSKPCYFCCGFGVDDETMKEEHETYHVAPDSRKPPILSDEDKAVMEVLKRDMGKYSLNEVTVTKNANWTPRKVLRVIREEEDPGITEFKKLQQMSQDLDITYSKIFYTKDGKQCVNTVAAKEYLRLNDEYFHLALKK